MAKIKPRTFKGTRDFTPAEMIPRERLINTIKRVFQTFGFSPLETPALEMLEVLAGKYGEEGDKLLYKLDYKNDRPGDRVALRYDLTVPLARLVASHPEWPLPFKRYQVQPVWRGDKPQIRQGRFREFYQCDIDTIGADEGFADAEIIALTVAMLDELGFNEGDREAVVLLNHRKILEGLTTFAGLPVEKMPDFCRILDKLDKIGKEAVFTELGNIGVSTASLDQLDTVFNTTGNNQERLEALTSQLADSPAALQGIEGLQTILNLLDSMQINPERVKFEARLARGLDYYTGAVWEAILPKQPHIGSLSGGGRYDELIGLYSGRDLPAVGATIGLDRMFAAMEQLDMVEKLGGTVTRILLTVFSPEERAVAIRMLAEFRKAGIPSDLFPQGGKMKKAFSYADKLGIPFVGVLGPDEAKMDPPRLTLKDLSDGSQETVRVEEAIQRIRGVL